MDRYTKEIKEILHSLIVEGCTIVKIDNRREVIETNVLKKAVEAASAYDEAIIFVKCPDGKERWLLLMLDNDPGLMINDYTCYDLFDKVAKENYNKYNP